MTITFTLTDIVAWVGALSGVGALLWQLFIWRRPGHKVVVSRTNAIFVGLSEEWALCVTARNVGTSAVTVTNWGVNIGRRGAHFFVTQPHKLSGALPTRLEPGEKVDFYVNMRGLVESAKERGVPIHKLRCRVDLATGQEIFASKKGIPYREGGTD